MIRATSEQAVIEYSAGDGRAEFDVGAAALGRLREPGRKLKRLSEDCRRPTPSPSLSTTSAPIRTKGHRNPNSRSDSSGVAQIERKPFCASGGIRCPILGAGL